MSTYGKLNLLLINSTYLVFPSQEMQRKLLQTKLYYKFFYSVLKEASHKPSKKRAARLFPKSVCYWYSLLRWMIFVPYDNWKTYFLYKSIVTPGSFATPCCCILWNNCFYRSPYFMSVNSTITLFLINEFF